MGIDDLIERDKFIEDSDIISRVFNYYEKYKNL